MHLVGFYLSQVYIGKRSKNEISAHTLPAHTHTARRRDGTVAVMEIATMKVKSNGDKSRVLVPIYGMASEKGSFTVNESLGMGWARMNPQRVAVLKNLN